MRRSPEHKVMHLKLYFFFSQLEFMLLKVEQDPVVIIANLFFKINVRMIVFLVVAAAVVAHIMFINFIKIIN